MTKNQELQACLLSLPAPEAAVVKRRLDRLRQDCGCEVGSIVMLSVTLAWIVHTLLVPAAGRSWQRTVVIGLVVLIGSALIGKLMGLGLARVRLHLEVRSLHQRLGGNTALRGARDFVGLRRRSGRRPAEP